VTGWALWFGGSLMEAARGVLFSVYSSLYVRPWLRLAGIDTGQGSDLDGSRHEPTDPLRGAELCGRRCCARRRPGARGLASRRPYREGGGAIELIRILLPPSISVALGALVFGAIEAVATPVGSRRWRSL